MKMKNSLRIRLGMASCSCRFITTVWVYQTLPENLAIHFDLWKNAFYLSLVVFGFSIVMILLRSYDLLDNHCQKIS